MQTRVAGLVDCMRPGWGPIATILRTMINANNRPWLSRASEPVFVLDSLPPNPIVAPPYTGKTNIAVSTAARIATGG